ncbi:MAG: hypothetical protein AAF417_23070, partial [Pseudomonadota bacterium]
DGADAVRDTSGTATASATVAIVKDDANKHRVETLELGENPDALVTFAAAAYEISFVDEAPASFGMEPFGGLRAPASTDVLYSAEMVESGAVSIGSDPFAGGGTAADIFAGTGASLFDFEFDLRSGVSGMSSAMTGNVGEVDTAPDLGANIVATALLELAVDFSVSYSFADILDEPDLVFYSPNWLLWQDDLTSGAVTEDDLWSMLEGEFSGAGVDYAYLNTYESLGASSGATATASEPTTVALLSIALAAGAVSACRDPICKASGSVRECAS